MPAPVLFYGGSFNPAHCGHGRLALECIEQLRPARFVFVPCASWPGKTVQDVDNRHRVSILNALVDDLIKETNGISTSVEIDSRELRFGGHSYTVDTLCQLRNEGVDHPVWLMGMDSWQTLDSWHRWRQLTDYGSLLVVNRPGFSPRISADQLAWAEPKFVPLDRLVQAGSIAFIETTPLQISSTQVRSAVAQGRSTRYLLPEPIRAYIRKHYLYQ